jgi:CHAD domain-containing protein
MTHAPCHFTLSGKTDPEQLLEHLASLGALQVEPPIKILRRYYDTFDWRLYAAGSVLIEERENSQVRTFWKRIADQHLFGLVMTAAPRRPEDLPPGPLRESLAKLIEMRILLPVASLQVLMQRVALLDKARKTILRMRIEEARLISGTGRPDQPLPMRMSLEPVKGYRKPYEQARELLHGQLKLEPAGSLFDEALAASGRRPQDYSNKLEVELQADMPAGEAVRVLLRRLLDTLERNLAGTIQDIDSEFLHDFRVAVRRTRSLLDQVRGVLPPEVAERYSAAFKWLGKISGATRDLDVYRLKLPGYRESLPQEMHADLQPLVDYLTRHQRQEQRKLARQLGSARCRLLLDEWREFLDHPRGSQSWPKKSTRPILEIANRRIWKAYRMVLKDGLEVREDTPPAAMHKLRISCKKLRYLMEFFQSLYPHAMMRRQIKVLKTLQDNLGDLHDLEVQADAMRNFGHALQAEKADLPGETFMAMGAMIDALYRRQEGDRRKFSELFARFAQPANQSACRRMLKFLPDGEESP